MKINPFLFCISLLLIQHALLSAQDESQSNWSMSAIEIKDVAAQKAVIMETETDMASVGQKMGEMYPALFQYIDENSIQPAGPSFAVYTMWDMEKNLVAFEAGIPVTAKCEPTDDAITYFEYPAMKALTVIYTGSYENMEGVYKKLMDYMTDKKIESTGTSWEVYLTDPNTTENPNMNQTQIMFPIKE